MLRFTGLLVLAAVIVVSASCAEDSIVVEIGGEPDTLFIVSSGDSSILVEDLILEVGDTAVLSAGTLNELGDYLGEVNPVWTTSNSSIAGVTGAGGVVGVSPGSAIVVAAHDGLSATIPVIVTSPPSIPQVPVATIVAPGRDTTIVLGDAVVFDGLAADGDGTVASHLWQFGNGTSATIEDPGSRTYTIDRTYEVTYVVTDNDGLTSTPARVEITVVDTTTTPPDTTTPPPPPPPADTSLVLLADWDQGLGTSTQAFSDGGVFDEWGGGAAFGGFEVKNTATEGRDFTTPTYLEISMVNGQDWVDMTTQNWDVPQIGQTVTASWEIRWTSPVGGQTTHGFYFDPDFGGENWGPPTLGLSIEDNATQWQATVWTSASASPDLGPIQVQQGFPLSKSVTYDFSLSYTRVSSNQFTLGFEIRDIAGTLIYDSSDFADFQWYAGTRSLGNTTFSQSGAGAAGVSGFRLGNNGLDVQTGPNQAIAEVANFRVSMTGG